MENKKYLIIFWLLSSVFISPGYARNEFERQKVKLFVFGDSYADTGNSPKPVSISWNKPYGITSPGKPSGRFSDGRVFTDYIASYLGIKSLIPYELIKNFDPKSMKYGVNFAYGGTGVFQTMVDQPNMTTQIDLFQQLIDKNVYKRQNLSYSIALVSLAGNDYSTYMAKNGSLEGLATLCRSVINQLITNLRRINGLGIKKIAITGIQPLGCLPRNTASDKYKNCNAEENKFSESHNQQLKQNISILNNESAAADDPVFIYLDLYRAFLSALKIEQNPPDTLNQLKPCCMGVNGEDCGSLDKNSQKKYGICEHPNQTFFWDSIHPSDWGWRAVYSALKPSLLLLK